MSDPVKSSSPLDQAVAKALDPHGHVSAVFASELKAALPWIQDEAAQIASADFTARRSAEHKVGKGGDLHATEHVSGPATKELVEMIVKPCKDYPAESAESLVHVYANLKAQRELHATLAERVYTANGPFENALASDIRQANGTISEAEAKQAAARFVQVRREKAADVAVKLRDGGEVANEAIKTAEAIRRSGDPVAASTVKPQEKQLAGHNRSDLTSSSKRIAFATHATLACYATDFLDPVTSAYAQTQEARKSAGLSTTTLWSALRSGEFIKQIRQDYKKFIDPHYLRTAVLSEFLSDLFGGVLFVAFTEWFKKPTEWFNKAVATVASPLVNHLAKKTTDKWAKEHNISKDSEEYKAEFAHWKSFQALTLSYDALISFFATATNVLANRHIFGDKNNPISYSTLIKGKLIGVALTQVLLLGSRWLAPRAVEKYENAFERKVIDPTMKLVNKLTGAEKEEHHPEGHSEHKDHPKHHHTPSERNATSIAREKVAAGFADRTAKEPEFAHAAR